MLRPWLSALVLVALALPAVASPASTGWSLQLPPAGRLERADLNGDGIADVVILAQRDNLTLPHLQAPAVVNLAAEGVMTYAIPQSHAALFGLDGRNGDRLWDANVPGYFGVNVVTADMDGDGDAEVVVAGSGADLLQYRGYVSVYDAASGAELGHVHVPDSNIFAFAVGDLNGDGVLDVVAGLDNPEGPGGAVAAFNGRLILPIPPSVVVDGPLLLWKTDINAGVEFFDAIALRDVTFDGVLDAVVTDGNGRIYAIDGASGRPLWRARTDSLSSAGIAVAEVPNGAVAVTPMGSGLLGLDATHGLVRWAARGLGGDEGLALAWKMLERPVVTIATTTIRTFDAATGELLWTYAAGYNHAPFAIRLEDVLAVPTGPELIVSATRGSSGYTAQNDPGYVEVLDARTGELLVQIPIGRTAFGLGVTPWGAGPEIVVAEYTGALHAFDLS